MADYTPPAANGVDFTFSSGYTPPLGNRVNLNFGTPAMVTIVDVSNNKIYDDAVQEGFDRAFVRWYSDMSGPYRVEMGGYGAETGDLIVSGNTFSNLVVRNTITDSDMEATTTFSGAAGYRINIYVYNSADEIWTEYQ